jgi:hypothetical protein
MIWTDCSNFIIVRTFSSSQTSAALDRVSSVVRKACSIDTFYQHFQPLLSALTIWRLILIYVDVSTTFTVGSAGQWLNLLTQIEVLCAVTPCSVAVGCRRLGGQCCLHFHLRNAGILTQRYMTSQTRKSLLESSPPWKFQISQIYGRFGRTCCIFPPSPCRRRW